MSAQNTYSNVSSKSKPRWRDSSWFVPFIVTLSAAFAFAAFIALLLFAHHSSWARSMLTGAGTPVESLGQLGDAFGPITSLFAAAAAVGAWMSYRAQREQLNDERAHRIGANFDEVFFRLMDFYDAQLLLLGHTNSYISNGVRQEQKYSGIDVLNQFMYEVIRVKHDLVDGRERLLLNAYESTVANSRSEKVRNFAAQLLAITEWLYQERRGVAIGRRGALLTARLSDIEVWLWCMSLASNRDRKLIQFARRLRIVGSDGAGSNSAGRTRIFTDDQLFKEIDARDKELQSMAPS